MEGEDPLGSLDGTADTLIMVSLVKSPAEDVCDGMGRVPGSELPVEVMAVK